MIDFYEICDECGCEILDNQPVRGVIQGEHVRFCSWRCFHKYEKHVNREGGGSSESSKL